MQREVLGSVLSAVAGGSGLNDGEKVPRPRHLTAAAHELRFTNHPLCGGSHHAMPDSGDSPPMPMPSEPDTLPFAIAGRTYLRFPVCDTLHLNVKVAFDEE